MRTLRVVCLLAAGVLALAACLPAVAPTAPPAEPTATVESVTTGVDLAGTSWMLSSLNGSLPLAGTMVTLAFGADDSVSGTDGCNQFRGTYAQDGEKLTFEQPMATTMMACEEPIMAQATAYMQALTATTAFIAIGTQLILRSDSEMLATFVAQSQSLAGTAWEVLGYNNGRQAVVSLLADTEITADFGADDQLSGNAGCNEYFAGYTADDGALTISEIGSTFRFCDTPEGVMQQEQEYLVALTTVATYGWEGNLMVLRTADGATAVQLAPRTLVDLPESEPGAPWGRVAAAQGVNIRSGPGVAFPVIGFARYGDEGRIVGRSADGQWWAVALPSAPDGMGWVSAAHVIATGAEDVVVVEVAPVTVVPPPAAPPPAAPPPTPLPPAATQAPVPPTAMPAVPTATPAAEISFWANRTNINLGECSRLYWSAANVQGVWVFPQGEPYYRFPRAGDGNEQVCPVRTTTYQMRVLQRDGSAAFREVTIGVAAPPVVPSPEPTVAPNPLADTRWEVINYNNGRDAVASLLPDTHIFVDFDAGGQVTGNAGCNNFFASYQLNGNGITVGQPGSTSMFCTEPEGVMDQEAEFLGALQSAATFRITGNMLELRTAGDQIAVIAQRMP